MCLKKVEAIHHQKLEHEVSTCLATYNLVKQPYVEYHQVQCEMTVFQALIEDQIQKAQCLEVCLHLLQEADKLPTQDVYLPTMQNI